MVVVVIIVVVFRMPLSIMILLHYRDGKQSGNKTCYPGFFLTVPVCSLKILHNPSAIMSKFTLISCPCTDAFSLAGTDRFGL